MTKPGLEPRFFCLQTLAHDRKASSGEGPCLVLPLAFPLGPHHSDSHRVLPCVWSEVTHFFIGSTNSLLTHCVEAQCSKSAFRESPVSPAWFLCAIWGGDIWTISLNIPKEAPQASLSSLRSWLISLVAEAFSDRPSSNQFGRAVEAVSWCLQKGPNKGTEPSRKALNLETQGTKASGSDMQS